jgi:hypothetical protein
VLTIRAIDEWFGGSVKQVLGNAALYLGEYYQKYLKKIEEEEEKKLMEEKAADLDANPFGPAGLASPSANQPVEVGSSSTPGSGLQVKIEEKKEVKEEEKKKDDDDEDEDKDEEPKSPTAEDLEKVHIVRWGEKVKGSSEASRLPFLKGRQILDCELEEVSRGGMKLQPFEEFSLKLGRKGGKRGNEERKVGKLKGICQLVPAGVASTSDFLKELLSPTEVFVRLYVLQGKQLTPMDEGGASDPYLIVSLGKQKVNLRKNHLNDTINPDFYESFEFPCKIPGISELQIEVWDWDGIGDDLIGSTVIDIEDRWFTPEWRALKKKPVESRTLRNPTSALSQGKITLWMDILTPQDAKIHKIVNIKPPAPLEYELRVIVWKTEDVTIKDEITEQNDLYLTGTFDVPRFQERQRTDTHLRSKLGKGSFNWRMIFNVEVPLMDPRFKVQIWDMDFFSANDSICEASISLRSIFNKAIATKGGHAKLVGADGDEKFWVDQLFHPNFPGKSQGKVQLSVELMPKLKCVNYPAGLGRGEPNQNPFLPPPEGRLTFNILKPWQFFKDILGDKIFAKCCCIIFCGLFIAAFATFAPTLLSTIVADLIT